jgi:hypothetical protein
LHKKLDTASALFNTFFYPSRQEIEYIDFPLPEGVKLFLDGTVLMVPSEVLNIHLFQGKT